MAEDDELWPQPDRVGRQVNYCLIEMSRVWWQLPGAWDCDWGRAHLVHNQQDRQLGNQRKSSAGRELIYFLGWCQPVSRPGRSPLFLLPGPGAAQLLATKNLKISDWDWLCCRIWSAWCSPSSGSISRSSPSKWKDRISIFRIGGTFEYVRNENNSS